MAQDRILSYFRADKTLPCWSEIHGLSAQKYVGQKAASSDVMTGGKGMSGRESSTTHSSDVVQLIAPDVRLVSARMYCCCSPS